MHLKSAPISLEIEICLFSHFDVVSEFLDLPLQIPDLLLKVDPFQVEVIPGGGKLVPQELVVVIINRFNIGRLSCEELLLCMLLLHFHHFSLELYLPRLVVLHVLLALQLHPH